MAGRGCTVTISVLGGSSGNGQNEELSLPVALHSPLSVLKDQLALLTNIATAAQVLILCDLNDAERNNDVLLEGRDYMSLRECGIRNGSFLTLHALGMSAERQQALKKKIGAAADQEESEKETEKIHSLETRITAAQANHSYNGVIFDVHCKGPYEVDLVSISIGGMLGRVRIFARDRPWEADKATNPSSHWWAHRESVSTEGWELIADVNCRPSWDKPFEIKFNEPLRLLPHQRRGLYCHSGLPDDLGIQYQSYSKDSIVAQDDHIVLLPGLGHTGNEPFDEDHGWYRAWRGLAGSVSYKARRKGWSPFQHSLFPSEMKDAVKTLLLCQNRVGSSSSSCNKKASEGEADASSPRAVVDLSSKSCFSPAFPSSSSSSDSAPSKCGDGEELCPESSSSVHTFSMSASGESSKAGQPQNQQQHIFHVLPKHVVYNIMEFMHWDWFDDVRKAKATEEDDDEDENDSDEDAPRRRTGHNLLASFFGGGGGGGGGAAQPVSAADLLAQLMAMHAAGHDQYFMQDDDDDDDDDDDSGDDGLDDEDYVVEGEVDDDGYDGYHEYGTSDDEGEDEGVIEEGDQERAGDELEEEEEEEGEEEEEEEEGEEEEEEEEGESGDEEGSDSNDDDMDAVEELD